MDRSGCHPFLRCPAEVRAIAYGFVAHEDPERYEWGDDRLARKAPVNEDPERARWREEEKHVLGFEWPLRGIAVLKVPLMREEAMRAIFQQRQFKIDYGYQWARGNPWDAATDLPISEAFLLPHVCRIQKVQIISPVLPAFARLPEGFRRIPHWPLTQFLPALREVTVLCDIDASSDDVALGEGDSVMQRFLDPKDDRIPSFVTWTAPFLGPSTIRDLVESQLLELRYFDFWFSRALAGFELIGRVTISYRPRWNWTGHSEVVCTVEWKQGKSPAVQWCIGSKDCWETCIKEALEDRVYNGTSY